MGGHRSRISARGRRGVRPRPGSSLTRRFPVPNVPPGQQAVTLSQHIEWFAAESSIDCINLFEIICAASEAADSDPALGRMERSLVLIRMMLDRGFQAVDLDGCIPWPDQRPDAVIDRIEQEWRRTDDEGLMGFSYWFHLPPALASTAPPCGELAGLMANAKLDYISLWQVILAANRSSDADPDLGRMERTLALLGRMLDLGFRAVDMAESGPYIPWPDQDRTGILERIEQEWRRTDDEPGIGAIFWFDLPALH